MTGRSEDGAMKELYDLLGENISLILSADECVTGVLVGLNSCNWVELQVADGVSVHIRFDRIIRFERVEACI